MKRAQLLLLFLFCLLLPLSGCEVLGDIFKASLYVGVTGLVLVVLLLVWLFRRFFGR